MSFEAQYYGRCTVCCDRIEPGDLIASDGDGGYGHDYCVEDDDLPPVCNGTPRHLTRPITVRVCSKCNQQLPAAAPSCENCT